MEGIGLGYKYLDGKIVDEECIVVLEVAATKSPLAEINQHFAEIKVGETVKFIANITPGFYCKWGGANMRDKYGQSSSDAEVCAFLEVNEDLPECHVTGLQPGTAYLLLHYDYDFDYQNWETSKFCECEIRVIE